MNADIQRDQKKASDLQELELQAVVSLLMWMLGTKPRVLCKSNPCP